MVAAIHWPSPRKDGRPGVAAESGHDRPMTTDDARQCPMNDARNTTAGGGLPPAVVSFCRSYSRSEAPAGIEPANSGFADLDSTGQSVAISCYRPAFPSLERRRHRPLPGIN